jgi:hypothetical protein
MISIMIKIISMMVLRGGESTEQQRHDEATTFGEARGDDGTVFLDM